MLLVACVPPEDAPHTAAPGPFVQAPTDAPVDVPGPASLDVETVEDSGLGETTHPTEATVPAPPNLAVALVLDVSGSMAPSMDDLRGAANAWLDAMDAAAEIGDAVAVSTYVGGTEPDPWVPATAFRPDVDRVRDALVVLDGCNCNLPKYEPQCVVMPPQSWDGVGSCWEAFCEEEYGGANASPWMIDCFDHGSGTNPSAGLAQAIDELVEVSDADGVGAVVLVADGGSCCGIETATRDANAVIEADRAASLGIDVWVVSLQDTPVPMGLARGLGTSRFVAAEDLADALADVAAEILAAAGRPP